MKHLTTILFLTLFIMPLFGQIGAEPNQLIYSNVLTAVQESQSLFIFNSGDAPLEITDLELSNEAYTVNPMGFPIVLLPEDTVEVVVFFMPTEETVYGGILTIYSDDVDNPEYEVSLIGNGVFITGLQESLYANVTVYPNPTQDRLSIDFNGLNAPWEISLIDIKGKQVGTFYHSIENQDSQTLDLDLSELPKGMYCLVLTTDGQFLKHLPFIKN